MKKAFSIGIFLFLLAALPVGTYLAVNPTGFFGFAERSVAPEGAKITNISDNSFTVSWTTQKEAIGFIPYGETDSFGKTAFDDRDVTDQQRRLTHHVTVKELAPGKTYRFKIGSGSQLYDNAGSPYSQKTAPTTKDPPAVADPAYGKIVTAAGVSPTEALVYLTVVGGTPLSSYIREDGNWLITLNNARTADLTKYVSYKQAGDEIAILVQAPEGVAQATTDTKTHRPVPNIILGETANFIETNEGASFSVQPVENVDEAETIVPLTISSPGEGGVVDEKPTFKGTGKPGEVIDITIESINPIHAKVVVGPDGTWLYLPEESLASGAHTVTIAQGEQSASSNFRVLAAQTTKAPTPTPTIAQLPVAGTTDIVLAIFVAGIILLYSGLLLTLKR